MYPLRRIYPFAGSWGHSGGFRKSVAGNRLCKLLQHKFALLCTLHQPWKVRIWQRKVNRAYYISWTSRNWYGHVLTTSQENSLFFKFIWRWEFERVLPESTFSTFFVIALSPYDLKLILTPISPTDDARIMFFFLTRLPWASSFVCFFHLGPVINTFVITI